MTKKKTPSENIETDQDNLMTTLESIRALLEQNEGKLTAARESISIANTNTRNDTSALHNMRSGAYQEQIVPILDDIVEPNLSSDSLDNIPELDSVFSLPESETQLQTHNLDTPSPSQKAEVLQETAANKPDLAILTAKNLIIDALDDLQLELEESLRETLMRTMVTLEKDLKDKISKRIETIKAKINK